MGGKTSGKRGVPSGIRLSATRLTPDAWPEFLRDTQVVHGPWSMCKFETKTVWKDQSQSSKSTKSASSQDRKSRQHPHHTPPPKLVKSRLRGCPAPPLFSVAPKGRNRGCCSPLNAITCG